MTPTQIYIKSILPLLKANHVKAFAHITGGGLPGNLCRVLPSHLAVEIDAKKWSVQPVFGWLSKQVRVQQLELLLPIHFSGRPNWPLYFCLSFICYFL